MYSFAFVEALKGQFPTCMVEVTDSNHTIVINNVVITLTRWQNEVEIYPTLAPGLQQQILTDLSGDITAAYGYITGSGTAPSQGIDGDMNVSITDTIPTDINTVTDPTEVTQ
jgi:hypothetical protein